MPTKIQTQNLGYPRIGAKRQLKRAVEGFWHGRISESELHVQAANLRAQHWQKQRQAGIDLIPTNDFSFYDQVLDTCALVGAVPPRFAWKGGSIDLSTYFTMARGVASESATGDDHTPAAALEMTKWFDTNYHYLVPELHPDMELDLASDKPFDEFHEALGLGIKTKPVFLGPVSFLLLGKAHGVHGFEPLHLLERLLSVYIKALERLAGLGAEWVQFDEPVLATDLTADHRSALLDAYLRLASGSRGIKLMVASYFGELRENLDTFLKLPVSGLHFDAVRGAAELDRVLAGLPWHTTLSLGVVNGRNIWRNDFDRSLELLNHALTEIGSERIIVAPSCSLLHSPVTLKHESKLDPELLSWLAFADEKLEEVSTLARLLGGADESDALAKNRAAIAARRASSRIHVPAVKDRSASVAASDTQRKSRFSERQPKQHSRLQLPLFPTTTIGSFPQTEAVRAARARFKKGDLTAEGYERFLEEETKRCVEFQEQVGLDVLVHGEFERNDMVEYFGEQLNGFAFTENGWVQSYGSRCVKPPIIYGDVSRPGPMSVRWPRYAQSLTKRPMKGMLTGPVTVLQWSFVRDDQPRSETARQIALALRDEVLDLERAGLAVIQIDEPALREGLPLRRADWAAYLSWAVEAFRLTAAGVRDDTQIHTHMCYCEFNDIIESVAALDADVISMETSRSDMELLEAFFDFRYPAEIGPGVWDIHSPRVPNTTEMARLLRKATAVLPSENLWVNPDCGLKTRGWAEVVPALENMVAAARELRAATPKPESLPAK
jgi:5-methyltetrahydropteroyltriglutamate--homocysteine methyltransferase